MNPFNNRNNGMPKPNDAKADKAPEVKSQEPVIVKPAVEDVQEEGPEVKPMSQGIEVIAVRRGFFDGRRKEEGDRFFIKKMSQLGDWMKCCEAKAQKQHLDNIASRKKRQSAGK